MNELQRYIAQCREQGISDDQIKGELIKTGWSETDVENAIRQSKIPAPSPFNPVLNSQLPSVNDLSSVENSEYIPGVMNLLSQAIRVSKNRFKTYLAVLLSGGGILGLSVMILVLVGLPIGFSLNSLKLSLVLLFILIFVLYLCVALWTYGAMLLVFTTDLSFKQIWKELTFRRVMSLLWTNFVATFVMFGSALLLFIPLILLYPVFIFYQYTVITQKVSGLRSLHLTNAYLNQRKLSVTWKAFAGPLLLMLGMFASTLLLGIFEKSKLMPIFLLIFMVASLGTNLVLGNYMGILYQYISNRKVDIDNFRKSKLITASLVLSVILVPLSIISIVALSMINPVSQRQKALDGINQLENGKGLNMGGLSALDPTAQRIKAHDTGRLSNIRILADGLERFRSDYPDEYAKLNIGTTPRGIGTNPGLVDLTVLEGIEIKEVRFDPVGGSKEDTKFLVKLEDNGEIVVMAESHYYDGTMIMSNQEFNFQKESTNIRRTPLPTSVAK